MINEDLMLLMLRHLKQINRTQGNIKDLQDMDSKTLELFKIYGKHLDQIRSRLDRLEAAQAKQSASVGFSEKLRRWWYGEQK